MNRANVIAGVICFALAVFVYWIAGSVPAFTATDNLGGRFFPRLISVMLMIASAGLIITGLLNMEISGGSAPSAAKSGSEVEAERLRGAAAELKSHRRPRFGPGEWRLAGFIAVMAVYTIILPLLGYIVSSVLTFAALIFIAGEHRPIHVGIGAVAITGMLYVLFAVIFNMNVPTASLF